MAACEAEADAPSEGDAERAFVGTRFRSCAPRQDRNLVARCFALDLVPPRQDRNLVATCFALALVPRQDRNLVATCLARPSAVGLHLTRCTRLKTALRHQAPDHFPLVHNLDRAADVRAVRLRVVNAEGPAQGREQVRDASRLAVYLRAVVSRPAVRLPAPNAATREDGRPGVREV